MKLINYFYVFSFLNMFIYGDFCEKKVLICGIAKTIGVGAYNTIESCEALSSNLKDFQIIIYENNSTDSTKEIFNSWAKRNNKVLFISEDLTEEQFRQQGILSQPGSMLNRIEKIARARNILLNEIRKDKYVDFSHLIMCDLDMHLWDVEEILNTLNHDEIEWDAVFGNGLYDLFAYRDDKFLIGFELIGPEYWSYVNTKIPGIIDNKKIEIDYKGPWKKVLSAFGGIGIYKIESIKNCFYSPFITKNLELVLNDSLESFLNLKNYERRKIAFLNLYSALLKRKRIETIDQPLFMYNKEYPEYPGFRINPPEGLGKLVWFGYYKGDQKPWTCEHVTFHADMLMQEKTNLYLNPKLKSKRLED